MKFAISVIRKIVIAAVGIPVFIIGIILIPAPGPGLMVCFLGLFILSLEFEWAQKHRDKAKHELSKLTKNARDRYNAKK